MDLKEEYLRKLKRGTCFDISGYCKCGKQAQIMFYDEKLCFNCWSKRLSKEAKHEHTLHDNHRD